MSKARVRARDLAAPGDYGSIRDKRQTVTRLSSVLRRESVAVVAEVKRSSPSKGAISTGLDSGAQAKLYELGGAAAISVLTEPERFGGSDADIDHVSSASALPILKKDFHVTEVQLAHAARLGVSAALVIIRAVDQKTLRSLAAAARDLDLEILYEIRDERELERALAVDARVIGVNNRNLETLKIDRSTVTRIVPLIPVQCIAIAESGYTTPESVEDAALAGADAVLVGSSLSASPDAEQAVRRIASIPRRNRGAAQ